MNCFRTEDLYRELGLTGSTDQQGTRNDQLSSDGFSAHKKKQKTCPMEIGNSLFLVDLLNKKSRTQNFSDLSEFERHIR